ncbi:MAG: AAA family ATPase [Muribaculaceae bacterium]|nr:AAA family ATPase [Muribaculaceae bacterium]
MIERIKISNYKSIRNAEIDLKMINILIGPNGAGKSNFISFFDLTRHLLEQRLGGYLLEHGGIDSILYRGRKISDNITALIDFENRNAFVFKLKPTQGPKAYIEYTKDLLNSSNLKDKKYEESWLSHVWDVNVEESAIMANTQWRAGYICNFLRSFTVYHFHDTSLSSPMRQLSRIGDNEYLRPDGSNLAAYLYKLKNSDIKSYNLIEGTIRSIAPYFKEFKLIPNKIMEGFIGLEWEERDTDVYLDATNFSDGTLRFIALATLLLQPDSPKTIIIDEPELGLHPAAIIKLGALIKRASIRTQIIIATQSIELMNNFSINDLLVVGRDEKQSTFQRLNEADFSEWRDAYSVGELWEKNIIGGRP